MPHPGAARFAFICLVLVVAATLGGAGCAGPRPDLVTLKAPVREAGVVFAVDGAGNFQACSEHLRQVLTQDRFAIEVATVEWSHGFGRIVADQIGYAYARAQGCKLARILEQFHRDQPGVPIFLLAHSAGSAVVIAALENLPPDSVERAFFLAPSLSATYDVRPALRAVKRGMHVFFSQRDTIYLGIWTGILGNSDRRWGPSSGRIGFQVPSLCADDAWLYSKLIQRPWQCADRAAGNDGKHYGDYQPEFLRLHVLPLLRSGRDQLAF